MCVSCCGKGHVGRLDEILAHIGCALSVAIMSLNMCHVSARSPLERPAPITVVHGWITRWESSDKVSSSSLPSNS